MILTFIGAILGLLLSFYILHQITDQYFIKSLDGIAQRFKMSDDAAGATLMASGSSAPELFIAIIALIYGGNNSEIGAGTIVGSALFNLLVIIGAVAFVRKATLNWQPMFRDFLFYFISILMLYFAFKDGNIKIFEVLLFIALYVIYVLAVIYWKRIFPQENIAIESILEEEDKEETKIKKYLKPLDRFIGSFFPASNYIYANFLLSIIFIALLSWLLVESAVIISEFLGIPSYIIALTVLAAGTSLPDMISSVIVAKQGRGGMATSNALGSNIFDILIGLGFPWLIAAIINGKNGFVVLNDNLDSHILFLIGTLVTVLLIFILSKWKLNKFIGSMLILLYSSYLVYIIINTTIS